MTRAYALIVSAGGPSEVSPVVDSMLAGQMEHTRGTSPFLGEAVENLSIQ